MTEEIPKGISNYFVHSGTVPPPRIKVYAVTAAPTCSICGLRDRWKDRSVAAATVPGDQAVYKQSASSVTVK